MGYTYSFSISTKNILLICTCRTEDLCAQPTKHTLQLFDNPTHRRLTVKTSMILHIEVICRIRRTSEFRREFEVVSVISAKTFSRIKLACQFTSGSTYIYLHKYYLHDYVSFLFQFSGQTKCFRSRNCQLCRFLVRVQYLHRHTNWFDSPV